VKLKLLYVYVISVLLYASETWALKKLDKDRLLAFEMKCYRWILHIQWQQKVRNEEVMKRIGANRNVFQIIIQSKTPILWPHLPDEGRTNVKAIVFGVMEGKARKGRPCREWTDDITDWCKEDLHTLRWKATDRAGWQRIVRYAIDTNG